VRSGIGIKAADRMGKIVSLTHATELCCDACYPASTRDWLNVYLYPNSIKLAVNHFTLPPFRPARRRASRLVQR
jgi:hypothetical protein